MSDEPVVTVEVVRSRMVAVKDRVAAAGGDPDRVAVVAVTKGFGSDVVVAAGMAGLVDLGESYAQELVAKVAALDDGRGGVARRWHFIGRLQRNKVAMAAPVVSLWQSIDRLTLGQELARRSPGAAVLVQVALTDDPDRAGCRPESVPRLVVDLGDLGLDVRGLMAVGPPGGAAAAQPGFRMVRALADRLELTERSMGMSADIEVAVREGSTMLRVGSALFGARPIRPRFRSPTVGN